MPSIMRIVLPALAAAGSAFAECTVSGTTTLQNSGDATALASCSTFSGSIAVATGATDDIVLKGIKTMKGNFVANGANNIRRIGAGDLEKLDGELTLNEMQRLSAVDFPKLKSVKAIKWNALPNLGEIGFTASVEQAESIDIQNTGLKSLSGINILQAKNLKVANNQYITEIKMQLGNVSNSLDFSDNNREVNVELTNLVWANNLVFRSCGSVALPSLEKLNGSLGLYNNAFESFAAPNLTEVGEALTFIGNQQLKNVSCPKVTKINDDFRIANNSALMAVDQFPVLKSVGGAFDISGNMTEVKTPKLELVKGAFNIQSSDNVTDSCPFYQDLRKKKLIQGGVVCKSNLQAPSTEGTNGGEKGEGSSSAAPATLSAMNGALGLAAMAAVFLI